MENGIERLEIMKDFETSEATVVTSFYRGPQKFKEAVKGLEDRGYRVASMSELARQRILNNGEEKSEPYGFVREGAIYLPEGKNILVPESPLLSRLEDVKGLFGNRVYLDRTKIEEILDSKDFVEFPRNYTKIPPKRFGEEELTIRAFGGFGISESEARKNAQAYGEYLDEFHMKRASHPNQVWRDHVMKGVRYWLDQGSEIIVAEKLPEDKGRPYVIQASLERAENLSNINLSTGSLNVRGIKNK